MYKIIRSEHLANLEKTVRLYLEEGWELQGSVVVEIRNFYTFYLQVVTKK
jgi:hypothetical protein